ncbi:hypothetical protein K438DRAFT_2122998 [Mycena galopus ATCC 62051]|nr:hypothetical protein K438DRAFT_2122998 [Mycena galopus ATCC 62051]
MAEALGTIASIVKLVDTALRTRELIQDFRHAPQEQQRMLSEMDHLRPLLGELQTRIAANPLGSIVGQVTNPLATFNSTMVQFTEKLRPGDGPFSKFSQQLKWSMWNKKEAIEYLDKFERFKSLINSWLFLDIWDMGHRNGRDNSKMLSTVNNATYEYRQQINYFAGNRQDAQKPHGPHAASCGFCALCKAAPEILFGEGSIPYLRI